MSVNTMNRYKKDKEKFTIRNKKYKQDRSMRVLDYLCTKSCMDCGTDDFKVLEFDHRDPKKKEISIARARLDWSWQKILKEIAKCDVVCANCHRIRTYERDNSYRNRRGQWKISSDVVFKIK